VLWKALVDEWRLAEHEVAYINRQQGLNCSNCGSSLRSMALARGILSCHGHPGPLAEFVLSESASRLRVLEVNEAGELTQFLRSMSGHMLVRYPEADMTALALPDASFDLVVHSDTLEHVPQPIRGLSECRRVLRHSGYCVFTVPLIVDRMTASREGLPPSYHGSAGSPTAYLVRTEYGADAWKHVLLAGSRECRVVPLEYPAGMAIVGVR
jgi:SAM-dependent methyltransferase